MSEFHTKTRRRRAAPTPFPPGDAAFCMNCEAKSGFAAWSTSSRLRANRLLHRTLREQKLQ
jgi:hypothetical protein